MAGSESALGEWVFGLPNGSMDEEPRIMAQVAYYDGVRTIGVLYDNSLIDPEIGVILTDDVTIIENVNGLLLFYYQSRSFKFNSKGILVNLFEKAASQSIMDGIGASDNHFCEFVICHLVFSHT